MGISGFTKALVVVGFSAFSSIASAAFIQTFRTSPGNDCSGVFGQGFANCKIPARIDPNESPIIIKFEFGRRCTRGYRDQFRAVPDDRRQRVQFRLHRRRRDRDLDIQPRGGRSWDQFLCREGWTRLQPLQQPGRSTYRRLVHTRLTRTTTSPLDCRTCRSTTRRNGVPEPTTLLLLGAGLFAAGFARRRFKRD